MMGRREALAFTAGFFCGDGCANITLALKRLRYKPRITFTQKDPQILKWIMEQFPQYHWTERASSTLRPGRITLHRNAEIIDFARELSPFTMGTRKKAELELLIAWPGEFIVGKNNPEKVRILRKQLFQKMKALKGRDYAIS